jgi:CBS domain-containing protein
MSKKIKDIMSRDVEVVSPDDSLQDAAKKMRSHDVGFLPVCDGQRLVGALTDRDIAIGAVAEGKDPKKMKVKDVASPDVCWCFDDQDPDDAAKLMKDKKVRRVMVIERQGKQLVGVLSVGDLATKLSSKDSGSVMEKTGPK